MNYGVEEKKRKKKTRHAKFLQFYQWNPQFDHYTHNSLRLS